MIARMLRAPCLIAVLCLGAATPASAFSGRTSAITYVDEQNDRQIRVFTISQGRLVESRLNGTTWSWIDHGLPPAAATGASSLATVTYVDAGGHRRIYVFVITYSNRLALRFFNGFVWQWADQGGPAVLANRGSAITYVDPAGNRRIYFFGGGDDGNLVTNYWNGANWQWASNGRPPGAPSDANFDTDTITYVDEQGNRRIDVFCSNYHLEKLFSSSWDGSSWSWDNHGGTFVVGEPRAVTFTDASGNRRIHVFAENRTDRTVRVHSWFGNGWIWVTLASPDPNHPTLGELEAIAYTDTGGNRRMLVLVEFDKFIYSRLWDDTDGWQGWTNAGLPPGSEELTNPVALTYFDSRTSTRRIHVFAHCAYEGLRHLCDRIYNGSTWQWLDLGAPP
jgi:hypothetical protein